MNADFQINRAAHLKCSARVLAHCILAAATAFAVAIDTKAETLDSGSREASGQGIAELPDSETVPPVGIEDLSEYLRGIDTLVATFSQENADETMSSGTIYIDRPFRARLSYSPPNPALIIANSGQVAVFDRKSNTGPNLYSLRRTPLYGILSRKADLANPRYLIGHFVEGEISEVHLRAKRNDDRAMIKLIFHNRPVSLRGWEVIDEFGNKVSVTLGNILYGPELDRVIFDIDKEAES